jgi:hypothetical protein
MIHGTISTKKKKKKKKKKRYSGKTVLGCFDVLGKGTNIENK